jgi:hypothetical protein
MSPRLQNGKGVYSRAWKVAVVIGGLAVADDAIFPEHAMSICFQPVTRHLPRHQILLTPPLFTAVISRERHAATCRRRYYFAAVVHATAARQPARD